MKLIAVYRVEGGDYEDDDDAVAALLGEAPEGFRVLKVIKVDGQDIGGDVGALAEVLRSDD